MPRKPRPWFRFYVEAFHDPKLRRLPSAQRWVWAAVLGAARQSPVPGVLLVSEHQAMDEHDLADMAAVPVRDVRKALAAFEAAGMVERLDGGPWRATNWGRRQFESDDTTERTRKHRSTEPLRNVPTTAEGTTERPPLERSPSRAPVTETETETEIGLQGGENLRTAAPPSIPPPRKCPAHSHMTSNIPACGECADARRAHDAWQRQQAPPPAKPPAMTELERTQAAQLTRAERNAAKANGQVCGPCGGTGWTERDDGTVTECSPCNAAGITAGQPPSANRRETP